MQFLITSSEIPGENEQKRNYKPGIANLLRGDLIKAFETHLKQ